MGYDTERVTDLGLAAALISRDFKMEGIDRGENGRACFLFTDEPNLEHALTAYWGNCLEVDARTYFDNIKMLKSRIYAGK